MSLRIRQKSNLQMISLHRQFTGDERTYSQNIKFTQIICLSVETQLPRNQATTAGREDTLGTYNNITTLQVAFGDSYTLVKISDKGATERFLCWEVPSLSSQVQPYLGSLYPAAPD